MCSSIKIHKLSFKKTFIKIPMTTTLVMVYGFITNTEKVTVVETSMK
jgi:hypothetical protein